MIANKCSHCGSNNVVIGRVWGDHHLRFRPENMKFLTASSGAKVKAVACLECGLMEFRVKPEEVKAIMRGENKE
jgi:hypothetical protein